MICSNRFFEDGHKKKKKKNQKNKFLTKKGRVSKPRIRLSFPSLLNKPTKPLHILLLFILLVFQYFFIFPFGSYGVLEVSEPLYAFTDNRIESPPIGNRSGVTVRRYEADIYKYDCIYHFHDQEKTIVNETVIQGFEPHKNHHYVYAPIASRYCEKLHIYHLKNAYVKHKAFVILSNGDYFKIFPNDWRWKPGNPGTGEIRTKHGYRVLFFVPIAFPRFFSHWITDGLAGIVLMPSWFWDLNPTILAVSINEYVRYSLELVGLGHIDVINTQDYVYGDDVFMVHGNELWNSMGPHVSKVIKQKYRAAIGLDKIEPVNYRFANKDNNNRRFTNLNEIIELANQRTGKNWSLITTNYREREAYAKEYASCLIVVTPCGSLAFNCIFMRDGTGIVSLCTGQIDSPQFAFCYYVNIWNIGVMHPYMRLNNHAAGANVDLTLDSIDKMIYTVANHHFPPGLDMFQPMCIDDAKKAYFEYGDQKFLDSQGYGNNRRREFVNRKRKQNS